MQRCEANSFEIAKINDEEENTVIAILNQFLIQRGKLEEAEAPFLGAEYDKTKKNWKWTSGGDIGPDIIGHNFAARDGSNGLTKPCLGIRENGEWFARECLTKLVICQTPTLMVDRLKIRKDD